MTITATRIAAISLVCVPTQEQDRAIEFYESLGFEKRTDRTFDGGYRWVEVYPPDGTAGIALATSDIDATHAALKSRGVDVDAEVTRMGDPPMFWFRDPSGQVFMVV